MQVERRDKIGEHLEATQLLRSTRGDFEQKDTSTKPGFTEDPSGVQACSIPLCLGSNILPILEDAGLDVVSVILTMAQVRAS
ncbi:hypothetical protein AVEN_119513-1 [Araneus ventricosus]|uniref:Uncharacterized protein n=1 Tax=Araneus ventricosus TaxID=182803 RepID=A0A4Y2M573_ARAVE|nr:hypothetical protein AVEN_119513-1 [Araneus ventricosus]